MNLFRLTHTDFNVQRIPFMSLVAMQLRYLIAVFFHCPCITWKGPHWKFLMIYHNLPVSCSGPWEMSCLVQTSLFCLQIQPAMIPLQDFAHYFFSFLETPLFLVLLITVALFDLPQRESGPLESLFPCGLSYFPGIMVGVVTFHQYIVNMQAGRLQFFICIFLLFIGQKRIK